MRKDTTFSDRKLTNKEFSDKYWMHGAVPYQYHTATIEDGRDEREQFIINNIRALWEILTKDRSIRYDNEGWLTEEVAKLRQEVQALRMKVAELRAGGRGDQ